MIAKTLYDTVAAHADEFDCREEILDEFRYSPSHL